MRTAYDKALSEQWRKQRDATAAERRLNEAAPELLEACKEALEFISNGIEFGYIRTREANVEPMLRAAISKATGR